MEPHCLGKNRRILGAAEAITAALLKRCYWIVRTGSPWRDLPTIFGNWNSVFKRDRDWLKSHSCCLARWPGSPAPSRFWWLRMLR
jgi:transposase